MCIVVDINTLAPVFNEQCQDHAAFAPVRMWILYGKGCLVYGGTKFKNELVRALRYLKLIRKLKDAHKACEIDATVVDAKETVVIEQTEGTDCDDQHIIALLSVSGCMLFCSADGRAVPYLHDRRFFPNRRQRPRVYRSARNADLLSDKFLVVLRHVV